MRDVVITHTCSHDMRILISLIFAIAQTIHYVQLLAALLPGRITMDGQNVVGELLYRIIEYVHI